MPCLHAPMKSQRTVGAAIAWIFPIRTNGLEELQSSACKHGTLHGKLGRASVHGVSFPLSLAAQTASLTPILGLADNDSRDPGEL